MAHPVRHGTIRFRIGDEESVVELQGITRAGRDPTSNELVIQDKEISRRHCRFESRFTPSGVECTVMDLGSANGTLVNGEVIEPHVPAVLRDGDQVLLGETLVHYTAPPSLAEPSPRVAARARPKSRQLGAPRREGLGAPAGAASAAAEDAVEEEEEGEADSDGQAAARGPYSARKAPQRKGVDGCLAKIKQIEEKRAARRAVQVQEARSKAVQQRQDAAMEVDADFARMLEQYRRGVDGYQRWRDVVAVSGGCDSRIRVCVRKRPLTQRERTGKMAQLDIASCVYAAPAGGGGGASHNIVIHEPRRRVDLTKYMENHAFAFDEVFDEACDNADVYQRTAQPLVQFVANKGLATCFAYGQTGSGKTFTMAGDPKDRAALGIYHYVARDVFDMLRRAHEDLSVRVSYFEIYGGAVYDLLNERKRLRVLEDGNQRVQVVGLQEHPVKAVNDIMKLITQGNALRASGSTSANERSSRSHAIFQLILRRGKKLHGKLSMVDLAGSERGADTQHADRRTRIEGAEINKSLLALKECIRSLAQSTSHTPFRASKLTQVLKDSFVGKATRTVMIATVSPSGANAEHTCNTLRYAARVKEIAPAAAAAAGIRPGAGAVVAAASKEEDVEEEEEEEEEEEDDGGDTEAGEEEEEEEEEAAAAAAEDKAVAHAPPVPLPSAPPAPGGKPRRRRFTAYSEADDLRLMHMTLSGASLSPAAAAAAASAAAAGAAAPASAPASAAAAASAAAKGVAAVARSGRDGRREGKEADDGASPSSGVAVDHSNSGLLAVHQAVSNLVREEEALLAAHEKAVRRSRTWLQLEEQLLVSSKNPDYDVDEYTDKLDAVLEQKMKELASLRRRLATFRHNLAQEEAISKQAAGAVQYF